MLWSLSILLGAWDGSDYRPKNVRFRSLTSLEYGHGDKLEELISDTLTLVRHTHPPHARPAVHLPPQHYFRAIGEPKQPNLSSL